MVWWCGWAAAQSETSPTSGEASPIVAEREDPSKAAPDRGGEVKPSMFLLPDKSGELQPILNFPYEVFIDLYRQQGERTTADPTPPYVVQSVGITGAAKEGVAELAVTCAIRLTERRWTRVPLQFGQALLVPEGDRYEGTGDCWLEFDEQDEGYVAWIRGEPSEPHTLTLDVLVPLSTVGDVSSLKMTVPQATSSELKLTVPKRGAVGEVSGRGTLVETAPGPAESTEFSAVGLAGPFELTWRPAGGRVARARPVLEAKGAIVVRADRRGLTSEAALTVSMQGGAVPGFLVALPRGSELLSGTAPGCSVAPVSEASGLGAERIVEIRRTRPPIPEDQAEPVVVRLTTRQSWSAAEPGGWFPLAGFEVIDAVQQTGQIAVCRVPDGQIHCLPGRGVRQIERVSASFQSTLENADVVAAFEYYSQPYSLRVRVAEATTRTAVEPKYRVYVEEGEVRLEADLKYTVRGAKTLALEVEFPGGEGGGAGDWEIDDVGPAATVDASADFVLSRAGAGDPDDAPARRRLAIPLAQPTQGAIEVQFRARRPIPPETSLLVLPLPHPIADSVGPAEVMVYPARNVELTPLSERTVGLVRQQAPAAPSEWESPVLSYRAETSSPVLAAQIKIHEQSVGVEVASKIELGDDLAKIDQVVVYEIAYAPLDTLLVDVPEALSRAMALDLVLDGQRRSVKAVPAGEDRGRRSEGVGRFQIVLPGPRLGKCELRVQGSVPMPALSRESEVEHPIPLLMPAQGDLAQNELRVAASHGVTAEVSDGSPWKAVKEFASPSGSRGLHLSADAATSEATLRLGRQAFGATVVPRVWVQTCLTPTRRFERAVFRFTTDRDRVELALPPGVDRRRIEVFAGPRDAGQRREAPRQWTREGHLAISLEAEAKGQPQWLEVAYQFSDPRPALGRLTLRLPVLAGETWVRRTYWQLMLPQNEHVVVAPEGLIGESSWNWNGLYWGREPLKSQRELEAWSGAQEAREPIGNGFNGYLFSSMGPIDRCELRTASRWSIVLAASFVALLCGLLLIYFPAARHPMTLLAATTVLGAATVLYPQPSLLALQASSLGLALALLAGLLDRTIGSKPVRPSRRDVASSILERQSTQVQPASLLPSEPPSTEKSPTAESASTGNASP
jgi:hypothetical protein